jgi:hypothetical protein
MDTSALVEKLSAMKSTEFLSISLVSELPATDSIAIIYDVEGTQVKTIFEVAEPPHVQAKLEWQRETKTGTIKLEPGQQQKLSESLGSSALYVLMRRYLFLLNASQRDDSLQQHFSADSNGQLSQIDFYPLMNLVTAYYESH